ncbi:MAG TPA: Gfo/Idh/MocA family oxidoreductase [Aggregatilineales bacterium]|nr:Gfo/Idh/MocA family oxidoreductase [Aggregatilineales bacterium]
MAKTRVAVVGAGGIGGTHLRAYKDWPDLCEIVGVADIQLPSAQDKAKQYGGKAYASYEQMLDEMRPDAVSVCTPPNLHLPVVRAAAARNLSVLCEKPPARTVVETQAIIEAMSHSKGVLQFAFCHRFHQAVVQAREMIASGRLGKIVQVYNRFGFRFERAGKSWFTDKETAGGGVMIDTLVHSVDIFRVLIGSEITHVSASVSTSLPVQVEDSASILVTSASGTAGSLNCSWVTPVSEAEIRIYATEGEAVIDYAQSGGLCYRLAGEANWTQLPFDKPDRFTLQAESFLKTAVSGGKPAASGEDAVAVMKVIEAAYQSVSSGTRVTL